MPLTAGSIAFTGFNADVADSLAFVALDAVPAGTVLYFSDNEFSSGAFNAGEGVIAFTAAAAIAPGTVIRLTALQSSTPGAEGGTAVRTGGFDISGANDAVYAYVGSDAATPTAFLAAVVNGSFGAASGDLVGTGLTAGETALALGATVDIAQFDGARTGQADFRGYLPALNTATNFVTQDGAGDQSGDGSPPDLPFSNTPFTASGGTGGGGEFSLSPVTLTQGEGSAAFVFTVTRTGGTGTASVNYATASGTATAGQDFTAASGTLTLAAGASATVSVAVADDAVDEADETFTLALSGPTNGAAVSSTAGTATAVVTDNDEPAAAAKISAIQGTSFFSPLLAAGGVAAFNTPSTSAVTVTAVVTAIDNAGQRQGFFLMEEETDWDTDLRTSEGLFVMTRNDGGAGVAVTDPAFAGLTAGETVTVTGFIMEYAAFGNPPRTFLVNPTLVSQSNSLVPLPAYVLDGSAGRRIPNSILSDDNPVLTDTVDDAGDTFDPENDALDFLETIEGMRVTVPDMVAADGTVEGGASAVRFDAYSRVHADADQINSRGGYTINGDPARSGPDTADPQDDVIRGGRHLHDGDANPDVLQLDFASPGRGGTGDIANLLTMGDRLGDVTGVIDFDFGAAKLFVTEAIDASRLGASPTLERTELANDARSLRVATFNVENLDPGDDPTADETAPGGTGRFNDIARTVAGALGAPDIISLEEIQDNNGQAAGGVDASVTLQRLADAVSAETGMRYQWVDELPANNAEGGAPNGNIRVAFLYNTARVSLGDLPADAPIEQRRQFTDRIGDGVRAEGDRIQFSDDQLGTEINTADWTNTRRTLLAEFSFNGAPVYVAANHWPAKGGSGDFYQGDQNIDAGEPENRDWDQRNAIAQDVWSMMDRIAAASPANRVVAAGDFNEFYFYRPLEVLTGSVDASGAARAGGARFTNLTVSELPAAERYTYVFAGRSQAIDHVVASQELADVAAYDVVHINTGFNSRTGAASPALSDHEPVLAQFDFRSFGERLIGTAGADVIEGLGGADTLAGGSGADTLAGGADRDTLFGETEGDRLDGGDGDDALFGNAGSDVLTGGGGDDGLYGGRDDDLHYGEDGRDVAAGGQGNDALYGNAGDDVLFGNAGNDGLYGGRNDDVLWGDEGDDVLAGGQGADRLVGGAGNDVLYGDPGDDRFEFGTGFGRDTVYGFTAGGAEDRIVFASAVFSSFDQVRANLVQAGDDALIVSGENLVILAGVQAAALTADDFLFN